jgi:hypothetical protein
MIVLNTDPKEYLGIFKAYVLTKICCRCSVPKEKYLFTTVFKESVMFLKKWETMSVRGKQEVRFSA